jgi:DNA-binding XRE family transcriptional regulator
LEFYSNMTHSVKQEKISKVAMTPAQCRAARAMLQMPQGDLARIASVSPQTLIAFELGQRQPYPKTLAKLCAALEAAGVVFLPENGNGPGVALRKT